MIESFVGSLNAGARYIIPLLLVGIPLYALSVKKVKVYEVFVEGAKDGFTIAVRIIPYLVAILVAVGMFRASGALDLLLGMLAPVLNFIGFPPENLPLALMRPLSGSGTVYFGSVAVTRSRHALIAGLTADAVGALSAVYICKLLLA